MCRYIAKFHYMLPLYGIHFCTVMFLTHGNSCSLFTICAANLYLQISGFTVFILILESTDYYFHVP